MISPGAVLATSPPLSPYTHSLSPWGCPCCLGDPRWLNPPFTPLMPVCRTLVSLHARVWIQRRWRHLPLACLSPVPSPHCLLCLRLPSFPVVGADAPLAHFCWCPYLALALSWQPRSHGKMGSFGILPPPARLHPALCHPQGSLQRFFPSGASFPLQGFLCPPGDLISLPTPW